MCYKDYEDDDNDDDHDNNDHDDNDQMEEDGLCCKDEETLADRQIISSGSFYYSL